MHGAGYANEAHGGGARSAHGHAGAEPEEEMVPRGIQRPLAHLPRVVVVVVALAGDDPQKAQVEVVEDAERRDHKGKKAEAHAAVCLAVLGFLGRVALGQGGREPRADGAGSSRDALYGVADRDVADDLFAVAGDPDVEGHVRALLARVSRDRLRARAARDAEGAREVHAIVHHRVVLVS